MQDQRQLLIKIKITTTHLTTTHSWSSTQEGPQNPLCICYFNCVYFSSDKLIISFCLQGSNAFVLEFLTFDRLSFYTVCYQDNVFQGVLHSAACVHHKLREIFRKVLSEFFFFLNKGSNSQLLFSTWNILGIKKVKGNALQMKIKIR